ncbi:TPA: hypothetical protein DIU27_03465 [Candidatus Collierbacteria bacterium]|uniref:Uncharacterized protein n=1 Tax=Candidatus Collierbacteria bacterium GW2011_GWB2_44_22 TaxID=1618387 RepID=A0A0G1HYL6_9BACT|nr:MAG: hypothetical protein UW31_C0007G0016 [Candidatus Collierbacteria bacterium GW2011_GWA2_44_13]KKT52246.1 MAG: hypothetical protein UW44_C0003G0089 [Candidatus Collierbacteria bacterium GW2011_GWB2_44_22]KKT63167.1 MAG: hypothetical protein UW56_C0001G0004 [Candidatus Collierbacteria bacterium GW2011_GWD1_44_27]KKT66076.1 MAG: hypothetical protein UW58_C0013G0004 [Candidatus Collierbacteria bacterium GW2011_GWC2_44_30]KKT89246.1 MAG: hypothetical protein UW88_C0004G0027 [Candidatus Collie
MGYYDPHHQIKVDLRKQREENFIREETATGPGRIYRPAEVPTSYEVVLLPHVRESRYFLALQDGSILVYVSCDKYYPSEPPHVYLGTVGAMKKLMVLSENSTGIVTEDGLLEVRNCRFPSWEGLRMIPLKMENYIFKEENGKLTVTPKK